MYNSILQFNEIGTKKIEKVIKNFMEDNSRNLGGLVLDLNEPLQELQRSILKEIIEELDEAFRVDKVRKKNYYIVRKDRNSILTTCGEVVYERTYFENRKTGEYDYLADKAMGITPNMRKSEDVSIKILEGANDSSYRLSGENATRTDDVVSKQTVMKELHKLEIPWIIPEVNEKRKQRVLYINADEDHVSLQFNEKKGDLEVNENGYKSNTIEPKLVMLFEGIEKESLKSQRNRLVKKHYFGGVYAKGSDLWGEVNEYIEAVYDMDYLEKIYIMGDGAHWIKNGVDVLGAKCKFVLDEFHLKQYINQGTRHLEDSTPDAKDRIYDAISFEDKEEIGVIFDIIASVSDTESKQKLALKAKTYILNHWDAIIIKNNEEHARMGCSAEGQISHILSSRLSRHPLGWSKVGVDKMTRLRVYKANGGQIIDLFKYKKEQQERLIREEIHDKVDKEIRKKAKRYHDVYSHETVAYSTGKVTGMYQLSKMIRGICG